jgi:Prasinovirus endonuclease VII
MRANLQERVMYNQLWRWANRDVVNAYKRHWRRVNRDKVAAEKRRWRYRHPHKEREICKRYRKGTGRLRFQLRDRIDKALKLRKYKKLDSTIRLLGCTLYQLRAHIESLFLPGMTWENRHLWHIDHIKPLAKFDLSKESEQRMAFRYTNLQPLWAKDNLSKGARYNG